MKKFTKVAAILAASAILFGGMFMSCSDSDDGTPSTPVSDKAPAPAVTFTSATETVAKSALGEATAATVASSDNTVATATVSAEGTVTIVSANAGSATITAKAEGYNDASIPVTVAANGAITLGTITKFAVKSSDGGEATAFLNWIAKDYAPSGTVADKTSQAAGSLGDITVEGSGATWRANGDPLAYYCLELGKNNAGCAKFTLTKDATKLTIEAASTGGSNTSDAILSTSASTENAIKESTEKTTVSGSSPTTQLVYNNISAGTYYFGAFPATSNKRGIRLYSIKAE